MFRESNSIGESDGCGRNGILGLCHLNPKQQLEYKQMV